jgi:hypothetical protein
MAELSNLESKLAEVLGLAQASQGASDKVAGLVDDDSLAETLARMKEEAAETERRCTDYAEQLEGKKTAILDAARETKQEATEMMDTYLGEDADGLDGMEFMIMAEAGEVGHWAILQQMNEQAGDATLRELTNWALPIQERHLETARESALQLAAREDALATA